MRLYLSSFRVGNYPERLFRLINKADARIAVVMNATDLDTKEEIDEKFESEKQRFGPYRYSVERLDLRNYFDQSKELTKKIEQYDCVWVRGGNTFVLRRAMAYSGFDKLVKKLLEDDRVVYAGYSAGVCVLQKDLKGIDIVDDPNTVPRGYKKEVIWEGLGLIPYHIPVHYKSDHPESALVDREVAWLKKNKMPYKTLKDGQVILINGDKEEFLE
jgi:dipeptidase E